MGYLFENMEHMDIQAERREKMEAQNRLNDANRKLDDAERKLDDMEKKLNNTEGKLDEARKNYLRLCKKCSLDKEKAVTELLKDNTLTQENAREIVNRYWDTL